MPLDQIEPDPEQPRKHFDQQSLSELATSIKKKGLLCPILLRPLGPDKYLIVNGERRYKAHRIAGLTTIKCTIRDLTDEEAHDIQLTENLERNNLLDIELAFEFQRRVKQGQTHQQIADCIGKTRSFVTQRITLLQLSKEIQERLLTEDLSFSNARELLAIKDVSLRNKVGQQLTQNTTVMQTANLINEENVTRVTNTEEKISIDVKDLAVYQLTSNRETVTSNELLSAIGKDLRLLRGEQ